MALREQILFHAKVSVTNRINESLRRVNSHDRADAEDGELLRQLGMPEFGVYCEKINECDTIKAELPTVERVHEFLKEKRDELWIGER